MKLTIHRGTHEIGGSCVELETENARILIDFGLPLTEDEPIDKKTKQQLLNEKVLPDIKGLYEKPEFDAILISHAHPDHYGLLSFVHSSIPIYMSKGTKDMIDVSYTFNQTNCDLKNVIITPAWKPFQIKDIKVTPYMVDHAAFDAMAFLIEAEGKRLFYTGDFRAHGRKNVLFENMIKKLIKDIDYMIMEGTMLSREEEVYKTETDVEEDMVKLLKTTGNLTFLSCSSQNIDRLVSAYKACAKTDTILVLDPYTAYVLYQIKDMAKVPQYDWGKNIKIFFIPHPYTDIILKKKRMWIFKKAKITKDEIFSLKNKMLVKDSAIMRRIFMKKKLLKGITLIYSQWEGYLDKVKRFWKKNDMNINQIHTSGHAYLQDLVKFANTTKPTNIIPIHTENADKFETYFKSNIIRLKDGQKFEL